MSDSDRIYVYLLPIKCPQTAFIVLPTSAKINSRDVGRLFSHVIAHVMSPSAKTKRAYLYLRDNSQLFQT